MAAAAILIVEFAKFYWLTVSGGARRITVSNFGKTGRSVAEILRFFECSKWPPPSWIFEIVNFIGYRSADGRHASACQI